MSLPLKVRPSASAPLDVVTLGENSLDFVAVAAAAGGGSAEAGKLALSQFRLQPGGQMATAALACARLGARTRYVGAFGRDEWGTRARAPLDAAGVEIVDLARDAAPGRVAMILVDAAGDRVVYEYRDPALQIDADRVAFDTIADARVLLVDATHPAAALQAARHARAAGTISIVDVGRLSTDVDALLALIDVVVMPEPFAAVWTGVADPREALVRARARCPLASMVVVTRGPEGALATMDGEVIGVPALQVETIDTTGAGDAFRAGLAVALLEYGCDATAEQMLRFASAVAALNCRALGAQGGLPTLGDVRRCLNGTLE
jgi:sugar/nucleoside kinase (ribokinase family)